MSRDTVARTVVGEPPSPSARLGREAARAADLCGALARAALDDAALRPLRPGGLDLTDRAIGLAGLRPPARVLDVGCGTGVSVAYLCHRRGLRARGLDDSEALLARGRAAWPELPLKNGRAESLPFGDGTFDAALMECVLSLIADRDRVLAELRRVLVPSGVLMLSDLYVRTGGDAAACRGVPSLGDRAAACRALTAAGFRVLAWEDHSRVLGRFVWDLAARREPLSTAFPEDDACLGRSSGPPSQTMRSSGAWRTYGYFLCVARAEAHYPDGPCAEDVDEREGVNREGA